MKRFGALLGVIIVTAVALALGPGGGGVVLGLPVVDVAGGGPAWISVGGTGVLCLGAGFGVVSLTIYGAGVLFATGQLAVGLICFAQVGIGLVFACVQVGAGLTGIGQGIAGGLVAGQGSVGRDGEEFLRALDRDVEEALRLPFTVRPQDR